MELLNGKKSHKLKFKKICLILFFALFTGMIILISKSSSNEVYEVSPESMKIINNNGQITVFVITPTYARPVQKAELTR